MRGSTGKRVNLAAEYRCEPGDGYHYVHRIPTEQVAMIHRPRLEIEAQLEDKDE